MDKTTWKDVDGAAVRRVRRSLGLTQEQFAQKLGVSKVTVARWESGQRRCRGEYAARIREFEREQSRGVPRTTTVFSVPGDVFSRMDPQQAIEAFRDLLWCEARRTGIPVASVDLSCREVADGGIDARVTGVPATSDGALVEGANYFQVKAGTKAKPWQDSWIRGKLFSKNPRKADSRDRLGSGVRRCLTEGGRYVLACFGIDPTPEQIAAAEEKIAAFLRECDFPRASVKVWGQQHLAGMFSAFPSLALRVMGRGDLEFQCHSAWGLDYEMSRDLCLGEEQQALIRDVRECLRGDKVRHVRVIGEPGLGKTRLVLEALSFEHLAPLVVYVPHAEDFQKSRLFNELLRPDAEYSLILVLDECRPHECRSIWGLLRNRSERCRMVSIDHDPEDLSDDWTRMVHCPPLSDEKITEIIQQHVRVLHDARRWAGFCSGSPRVAHLVGENLHRNPEDLLKGPSTVDIWTRFVAGYDRLESPEARQKLTVLRHVALFERFGFEPPVEQEAQFICKLAQDTDPDMTWGRFQSIVRDLKQRRILQGKTTLFIVPRLLHVWLWLGFWDHHGRGLPLKDLIPRLPGGLAGWFIAMFCYGHASAAAKRVAEDLLGPEGPFSDPRFVDSEMGGKFLNELAVASPEAALRCIERTLGRWDHEALLGFTAGRQYVVWALEKIAVWPDLFCRAAALLLKLAEAENATNSNNASGTFGDLFSLAPGRVAPTGASPQQRLPALQTALESKSPAARRVAIKACGTALSTHFGGRLVGREHQGLRPTAALWTPDTWGEVHEGFRAVWNLLAERRLAWDTATRADANAALVEAAFELLQIDSLAETVLKTLDELAEEEATDLSALLEVSLRLRRLCADELAPSVASRLAAIDERITGATFATRLRRVVHLSGWEDQIDDETGRSSDAFSKQVSDLATELLANVDEFHAALPDLVRGGNNVVAWFGHEIGRRDEERRLLPKILDAYRSAKDSASSLFLGGYLAPIFSSTSKEWETIVCGLMEQDEFSAIVGPLVAHSGFTDRAIEVLLRRYDAGQLDIGCLRCLRYSYSLRALREENVHAIVERVLDAGKVTFALELVDFVYCDEKDRRTLPRELTLRVLRGGSDRSRSRGSHDPYHWGVIAGQFVSQHPESQGAVFEAALDRVCKDHWFADGGNRAYEVVAGIVRSDPERSWRSVAERLETGTMEDSWQIQSWLGPGFSFGSGRIAGPIALFPCESVLEWVAAAPEERARLMARSVPKTLAREEGGTLTRELLNRYGDREDVQGALFAHFGTEGWRGSAADHHRRKRDEARKWLEGETSSRVRNWIEAYIDGLSHSIIGEEIEEERRI